MFANAVTVIIFADCKSCNLQDKHIVTHTDKTKTALTMMLF